MSARTSVVTAAVFVVAAVVAAILLSEKGPTPAAVPSEGEPAPAAPMTTRPVAVYEWPPYVDDLQPDEPRAYPGLDVRAKNPFMPAESAADLRNIRVHVTPGLDPDGSTRRILGVHFRGPPGLPLAAHAAYVAQSHAGWTSTRHDEGSGYSFASGDTDVPMPETGFTFTFVVRAAVLDEAVWRDATILLSNAASTSPPDDPGRADSLVGNLYKARRPGTGGVRKHPIRLPYVDE